MTFPNNQICSVLPSLFFKKLCFCFDTVFEIVFSSRLALRTFKSLTLNSWSSPLLPTRLRNYRHSSADWALSLFLCLFLVFENIWANFGNAVDFEKKMSQMRFFSLKCSLLHNQFNKAFLIWYSFNQNCHWFISSIVKKSHQFWFNCL